MTEKYCPRCQQFLSIDHFYTRNNGYCRNCQRAYMRAYMRARYQFTPRPDGYRVHPHHCRACGETKTEADFYYSSGNRSSYCKACTSIRNAEYRRLHPRRKTNHAIEYRSQKLMAFARKLKS